MLNLRWFMLFLLLNTLLCSYGKILSCARAHSYAYLMSCALLKLQNCNERCTLRLHLSDLRCESWGSDHEGCNRPAGTVCYVSGARDRSPGLSQQPAQGAVAVDSAEVPMAGAQSVPSGFPNL